MIALFTMGVNLVLILCKMFFYFDLFVFLVVQVGIAVGIYMLYCLKKIGVTDIISFSAVGSLKENIKPGNFLLVDHQFLLVQVFLDL